MRALKRAVFLIFLVSGALLGHTIAYTARYGLPIALWRESTGVHAYLAPSARVVASAAIAVILVCLSSLLVLRDALHGDDVRVRWSSPLRAQVALFLGQAALYLIQETIEARLAGGAPDIATLLWIGLPAQALVAVICGWLFTRLWFPLVAFAAEYEQRARRNLPPVEPQDIVWLDVDDHNVPQCLHATVRPRAPPFLSHHSRSRRCNAIAARV